jgi:pimeloyl-ACP methyl ester carboxylesterase
VTSGRGSLVIDGRPDDCLMTCRYVMVDGVGHYPHTESPHEVCDHILTLVKSGLERR